MNNASSIRLSFGISFPKSKLELYFSELAHVLVPTNHNFFQLPGKDECNYLSVETC